MANIFDISDKTINQAIGDIDLSPAMIYLFDVVNANALPFLASQFDVEGFKGWDLAITEIQKRELLKTAMQIKKHLGTPYAIKQALIAVLSGIITGYDKITIQEGRDYSIMLLDGSWTLDGNEILGGHDWASFTVTVKTKHSVIVSSDTKALIVKLILYYKNARSKLREIIYQEDDVIYLDGTWQLTGDINLQ